MGAEIPDLSEREFCQRLESAVSVAPGPAAVKRMYQHYRELRRWNRRAALIGSGIADQVVERLFAESLAALPLLEGVRRIVDVGSGAGFPGLVIAAARPECAVVLVEPRQRKWAFLRAAAARASLSCTCLNARVAAALPSGLPETFDRVTVRALRLGAPEVGALAARLTPRGAFLLWATEDQDLLPGLELGRSVELDSGRGRILELFRARIGPGR